MRKICVVGAGVIGLSCAIRLQDELKDIDITIISEEFSPNTTGDGSAGWIRPFLSGDTPEALMRRWCKETSDYLMQLAHGPNAGALGIYTTSGYEIFRKPQQIPYWSDLVYGFRTMSESEVTQLFTGGYKYGFGYTTLHAECKKYLPWLMNRFTARGGHVITRKVHTLSELYDSYDLIVNCTGIGAREVVNDNQVHSLKGQLIRVEAPWIKHFLNVEEDDLYIIASAESVALGGTHEEDVYHKQINQTHRARIWEGCCRLMPSLREAKVTNEWAGFRPGRSSIRLEKELIDTGRGRTIPVVHSYGHGGSGVTLHWGCAGDVVQLVSQHFNSPAHNKAKL